MKRIVILGGGTGGTLVANRLRRAYGPEEAGIDRVEADADRVYLDDGTALGYDVLVVATGAQLLPEETDGLTGPGWMRDIFTFYTPEGATALRAALDRFDGGRLAVSVIDMPIKCPVAPLEFCFLADDYFTRRGIRNRVELVYVTPLDGAFTKPVASRKLSGLLADKVIELVTEFNTGTVEAPAGSGAGYQAGRLVSYDERAVPFD